MTKSKPESVVVGIDPAMVASGWAVRTNRPHMIEYGEVVGVENVGADMDGIAKLIEPKAKIVLMIEYPTWKGFKTEAVRAAANCWIRVFKAAFPRRVTVYKVSPQTWMAATIPGWHKAKRPADLYIPKAAFYVDPFDDSVVVPENAAAAVCIMLYAEQLIKAGTLGIKTKKKAAKPCKGSAAIKVVC